MFPSTAAAAEGEEALLVGSASAAADVGVKPLDMELSVFSPFPLLIEVEAVELTLWTGPETGKV